MMKTRIEWPKTYYTIDGLMGFSAEHVDYSADDFKAQVVPMVSRIITELENKIEELELQLAHKPKFKWLNNSWVLLNEY